MPQTISSAKQAMAQTIPPAKQVAAVSSSKAARRSVRVILLDKKELVIAVENKGAKVDEIFQKACECVELKETEFFGLALLKENEFEFVACNTKLHKLAPKIWKSKDCSVEEPLLTFYLRVQYYVDHIGLLKDRSTRLEYYLQLRDNLLHYSQMVSEEKCFLLASYALQADFGDYSSEMSVAPYFDPREFFPAWVVMRRGQDYITQNLPSFHRELSGTPRTESRVLYINELSTPPCEHNFHFYKLRRRKYDNPGTAWIAICPKGIEIYEEVNNFKSLLSTFLWSNIGKLSCEKKKFEITIDVIGGGSTAERKFAYYTSTKEWGQHLLDLCRATHRFYMSIVPRIEEMRHQKERDQRYRETFIHSENTEFERRYTHAGSSATEGGSRRGQTPSRRDDLTDQSLEGLSADHAQRSRSYTPARSTPVATSTPTAGYSISGENQRTMGQIFRTPDGRQIWSDPDEGDEYPVDEIMIVSPPQMSSTFTSITPLGQDFPQSTLWTHDSRGGTPFLSDHISNQLSTAKWGRNNTTRASGESGLPFARASNVLASPSLALQESDQRRPKPVSRVESDRSSHPQFSLSVMSPDNSTAVAPDRSTTHANRQNLVLFSLPKNPPSVTRSDSLGGYSITASSLTTTPSQTHASPSSSSGSAQLALFSLAPTPQRSTNVFNAASLQRSLPHGTTLNDYISRLGIATGREGDDRGSVSPFQQGQALPVRKNSLDPQHFRPSAGDRMSPWGGGVNGDQVTRSTSLRQPAATQADLSELARAPPVGLRSAMKRSTNIPDMIAQDENTFSDVNDEALYQRAAVSSNGPSDHAELSVDRVPQSSGITPVDALIQRMHFAPMMKVSSTPVRSILTASSSASAAIPAGLSTQGANSIAGGVVVTGPPGYQPPPSYHQYHAVSASQKMADLADSEQTAYGERVSTPVQVPVMLHSTPIMPRNLALSAAPLSVAVTRQDNVSGIAQVSSASSQNATQPIGALLYDRAQFDYAEVNDLAYQPTLFPRLGDSSSGFEPLSGASYNGANNGNNYYARNGAVSSAPIGRQILDYSSAGNNFVDTAASAVQSRAFAPSSPAMLHQLTIAAALPISTAEQKSGFVRLAPPDYNQLHNIAPVDGRILLGAGNRLPDPASQSASVRTQLQSQQVTHTGSDHTSDKSLSADTGKLVSGQGSVAAAPRGGSSGSFHISQLLELFTPDEVRFIQQRLLSASLSSSSSGGGGGSGGLAGFSNDETGNDIPAAGKYYEDGGSAVRGGRSYYNGSTQLQLSSVAQNGVQNGTSALNNCQPKHAATNGYDSNFDEMVLPQTSINSGQLDNRLKPQLLGHQQQQYLQQQFSALDNGIEALDSQCPRHGNGREIINKIRIFSSRHDVPSVPMLRALVSDKSLLNTCTCSRRPLQQQLQQLPPLNHQQQQQLLSQLPVPQIINQQKFPNLEQQHKQSQQSYQPVQQQQNMSQMNHQLQAQSAHMQQQSQQQQQPQHQYLMQSQQNNSRRQRSNEYEDHLMRLSYSLSQATQGRQSLAELPPGTVMRPKSWQNDKFDSQLRFFSDPNPDDGGMDGGWLNIDGIGARNGMNGAGGRTGIEPPFESGLRREVGNVSVHRGTSDVTNARRY